VFLIGGDIVWLKFTPQAGREQQGTRPAIIISPKIYNKKTNLALCCPLTSTEKPGLKGKKS
jgi:mRNA interferase MazF